MFDEGAAVFLPPKFLENLNVIIVFCERGQIDTNEETKMKGNAIVFKECPAFKLS